MSDEPILEDPKGSPAFERFVAGVAHELNNFVGVILGNVHLVSRLIAKDHDANRFVEEIRKAAERNRLFARQLGLLGPRERQQTKTIELAAVIERVAGAEEGGPEIVLELAFPLEVTDFDLSYFETALAGWIEFVSETPGVTKLHIRTRAELGAIALTLEDDGPSPTPAETAALLDPFATLADRPRTGLRLALLADFASRSHGSARAYQAELGGIGIELTLRAADVVRSRVG